MRIFSSSQPFTCSEPPTLSMWILGLSLASKLMRAISVSFFLLNSAQRFFIVDHAAVQVIQNAFALFVAEAGEFVLAGFVAQGADHFKQSIANGGVGEAEIGLHAGDLAFIANEKLNEGKLLFVELAEGAALK